MIDHAEALQYINRVREAWGWEPLAGLPKSVPNGACNCVLGRSWSSHLTTGGRGQSVRICFETGRMTELAAEALDTVVDSAYGVKLDPEHPLAEWMHAFDSCRFPELIADGYSSTCDDLMDVISASIDPDEQLVPVEVTA